MATKGSNILLLAVGAVGAYFVYTKFIQPKMAAKSYVWFGKPYRDWAVSDDEKGQTLNRMTIA